MISQSAFSQDLDWHKSDSVTIVDGMEYYYHIVQKGQTAYGISKLYNIPLKTFFEYNPEAFRGIRTGEPLLIPLSLIDTHIPAKNILDPSLSFSSTDNNLYIYHHVKTGETYYSISKMYQIELADLRKANSEIGDVLPEGVSLRIPYDQNILTGIKMQQENSDREENVYIVRAGETLSGIAKLLNTTREELIRLNPDIMQGMTAGDAIIVPPGKIAEKEPSEDPKAFHVVVGGETVYSISKRYGISIDSLLFYNDHISKTQVKIGDTLIIPFYNNIFGFIEYRTTKKEQMLDIANRFQVSLKDLKDKNPKYKNVVPKGRIVLIPVEQETPQYPDIISEDGSAFAFSDLYTGRDTICIGRQDEYKTITIALMMPFASQRLDKNSFIDMKRKNKVSDYAFFNFIQFYQGILLALDNLKEDGYNILLNVYDVTGKNSNIESILNGAEMKKTDLIIAMITVTPFQKVSDFALQNNIPLINVASARDDVLEGYPNVVKIIPSETTITETVMEILPDNDGNINLIVAKSNDGKHSYDVEWLRRVYPGFQEVPLTEGDKKDITNSLRSDKKNYILAISQNKLVILDLMRVLDEEKKKYDITLIGYPHWDAIPEMNYRYAQNLKLHFVSSQFIDYKDEDTNNFIFHFRAHFNNEPHLIAFQGYDIASYFIRSVALFGKNCIPCAEHVPYHFISTQNMIFANTPSNGYSNIYWNVYTIDDLQQKKVER
jgi:LysM repeat protein